MLHFGTNYDAPLGIAAKRVNRGEESMQSQMRLTDYLLRAGVLLAITICVSTANADTVAFSDDFNRPDGPVGNGWSTWGNPNSSLVGGQLQTFGQSGTAGGVARALTVTFPVTFSFDLSTFNTRDDFDPTLPYNDGGWYIAFNADSTAFMGPAELFLYQYAGSRTINRVAGSTSDSSPGLPGRIPGWEDYNSSPSLISGTVNADLSALITITYSDGTSVSASFGAAGAGSPGGILMLGNANRSAGPDDFDNLLISSPSVSPVPEPPPFALLTTALALTIAVCAQHRSRRLLD
jgi:hypothetical protein